MPPPAHASSSTMAPLSPQGPAPADAPPVHHLGHLHHQSLSHASYHSQHLHHHHQHQHQHPQAQHARLHHQHQPTPPPPPPPHHYYNHYAQHPHPNVHSHHQQHSYHQHPPPAYHPQHQQHQQQQPWDQHPQQQQQQHYNHQPLEPVQPLQPPSKSRRSPSPTRQRVAPSSRRRVSKKSPPPPSPSINNQPAAAKPSKVAGGSTPAASIPPVKQFQCPAPGCNKVFTRRFNLQSHELVHSNLRPFKCDLCDGSFRRKFDLRRHMRSLHTAGSKPYTCELCGLGFTRSDTLRRHRELEALRGREQALADAPASIAGSVDSGRERRVERDGREARDGAERRDGQRVPNGSRSGSGSDASADEHQQQHVQSDYGSSHDSDAGRPSKQTHRIHRPSPYDRPRPRPGPPQTHHSYSAPLPSSHSPTSLTHPSPATSQHSRPPLPPPLLLDRQPPSFLVTPSTASPLYDKPVITLPAPGVSTTTTTAATTTAVGASDLLKYHLKATTTARRSWEL